METNPKLSQFVSESFPENGQYRLALYFGGRKAHKEFWIDDIVLKPLQNEQVAIAKKQINDDR